MSEPSDWAFPAELQPSPGQARFDLEATLNSVVMLRAEVPQDAFTASILGTERIGNGVVIRADGLVLTIGYLITEAQTIWLTTNGGSAVAGHSLAYDQATGFGLVQPLGRLGLPALERGSAKSCGVGDEVTVIGYGGRSHALQAKVIAKREFAGYWEYVLDEALFTAPAHPQWGGAALVGADGRLVGIGSLLVQEALGDEVRHDPLARARRQAGGAPNLRQGELRPVDGERLQHLADLGQHQQRLDPPGQRAHRPTVGRTLVAGQLGPVVDVGLGQVHPVGRVNAGHPCLLRWRGRVIGRPV